MTGVKQHGSFADMTQAEFDDILHTLVNAEELMAVPGVHELAAEAFNNDVLEAWAYQNDRCEDCGARIDEDGACPACEPPPQFPMIKPSW